MISEHDLLGRFEAVQRRRDDEWLVRCPAHDDRTPSLHITLTGEKWLLHCLAGCPLDGVLGAAGIDPKDLFAGAPNGNGHRHEVESYRYTDEHGAPLYDVVRFEPKDFRQRRPNGAWGIQGARRVLYRLPRVVEEAQKGGTVYVVEGERDVHALEQRKLVATCNPGGAGKNKWRPEYSDSLRGAVVIVVADRDVPGYEHAAAVVESVRKTAASVRLVEPAEGKDISDHLRAGRTIDELRDVGKPTSEPRTGLAFMGAAELREQTPERPDWLWEDYIAKGSLVIPGGKPKAGKSTLMWALCEAIVLGVGSFLGRRVGKGKVVYVSEEAAITLRHKLPKTNDLRVLTREGAWPKPSWVDLVNGAVEEAKRIGAVLLVIDTFAYWAQLAADQEKDSGATTRAIEKLIGATAAGIAVVLVHHQRKGGGEEGEGLRGSGAIAGSCDMILEIERVEGDGPRTQRQVVALGRWTTTPGLLIVDWDQATGSWRVIGEGDGREEAGKISWPIRLVEAVAATTHGITICELEQVLGAAKKEWTDSLRELIREGTIERLGMGKKGAPYRHYIASTRTENASSASTEDSVGKYGGNPPTESHRNGIPDSVDSVGQQDVSLAPNPTETAHHDSVGTTDPPHFTEDDRLGDHQSRRS